MMSLPTTLGKFGPLTKQVKLYIIWKVQIEIIQKFNFYRF